jgi:DNA/RNA endonuclease G (NUC1)
MKYLSALWSWLVRVFSLPPKNTEPHAPTKSTTEPPVSKPPVQPKSEHKPPPIKPTAEPPVSVPTAQPKSEHKPLPATPKEEPPISEATTQPKFEDKPPTAKPTKNPQDPSVGKGFDTHFLPVEVPLPKHTFSEILLPYRHFSVSMNVARKMPYYTAVNIDAVKYNQLKKDIPSRKEMGADAWIMDPRLPKTEQLPKTFYSENDFDLGHMVRREDPLWGETLEEALAANDDTFYLTNATPQHKDFNRNSQRWKGLEDYALSNARKFDLRLSVFSGCVFKPDDRSHKKVQIPAKFWKILVMTKEDGTLSATGYIVQQDDLIQDITERELGFVYEQFKTYQVPITDIEAATGLTFGLNDFDPKQKTGERGLEAPMPSAIDDLTDIVF